MSNKLTLYVISSVNSKTKSRTSNEGTLLSPVVAPRALFKLPKIGL